MKAITVGAEISFPFFATYIFTNSRRSKWWHKEFLRTIISNARFVLEKKMCIMTGLCLPNFCYIHQGMLWILIGKKSLKRCKLLIIFQNVLSECLSLKGRDKIKFNEFLKWINCLERIRLMLFVCLVQDSYLINSLSVKHLETKQTLLYNYKIFKDFFKFQINDCACKSCSPPSNHVTLVANFPGA